MAAFRAAVAAGAGIECDVRIARDAVPIVFHDADLQRLCGVARHANSLSSHETLNSRLLGTDEHIPSLSDVLELVGRKVPLLLELKSERGTCRLLCGGVAECLQSVEVDAAVMSFDPGVCRWFARNAPDVRRGIVMGVKESRLRRWTKLRMSRAQFAALETSLVPTRWAQALRRKMPIATWTVRAADQREMLANQVDALIWEGDGRPRN